MEERWRKYLSVGAPRYTSYPSALHFDEAVSARDLEAKLAEVGLYEPLSIYVHVPFCRQLCWYCGCNMRVENYYERARHYVSALLAEIATWGAALGGRGRPTNIHFGGGTPNYLPASDLEAILTAIEREIGLTDDAALSIEIDPRLLRSHDADALAGLGFRRFSLGVQDFDPAVQKAINRVQSFELVEECVSEIRAAGVTDLSFDILYGLPKQTAQSFAETMDKVAALAPDRVSVFGYAHLPSALPHQRLIDAADLPGEALRLDLAERAGDKLEAAGYVPVGFDHYARPGNDLANAALAGRLKRNFQGFTADAASTLVAFGPSAISFVDGLYAQNEKSIGAYSARALKGEFAVSRGLVRSRREAVIATAINDFLCRMAMDVGPILKNAQPEEAVRLCERLDQLESDGVISWRGDIVEIAPGARALARIVAAAIDPYAGRNQRFSAAV